MSISILLVFAYTGGCYVGYPPNNVPDLGGDGSDFYPNRVDFLLSLFALKIDG